MSTLEPSIAQMLDVGKGCGLNLLVEAYDNYLSHYDLFFRIEHYQEQMHEFITQLMQQGWTMFDPNTGELILDEKLTIDECMKQIGFVYVEPDYSDLAFKPGTEPNPGDFDFMGGDDESRK